MEQGYEKAKPDSGEGKRAGGNKDPRECKSSPRINSLGVATSAKLQL